MSRPASLTVQKGGIDRLRTKGGARADTLYDLVNGFITEKGTIKARPGTWRRQVLPSGTIGLTTFNDCLNVFASEAIDLPQNVFTLEVEAINGHVGYADAVLGDISPHADIVGNLTFVAALFRASDNRLTIEWDRDPTGIISEILVEHDDGEQTLDMDEAGPATATFGSFALFWILDGDWTDPGTNNNEYVVTFDPETALDYCLNILLHPSDPDATLVTIHFAKPFLGALYVVAEFDSGEIFDYWLQEADEWEGSTEYSYNEFVRPTTDNGLVFRATRFGQGYPRWSPGVLRTEGNGSSIDPSIIEPTVYNEYYFTAIDTQGDNPRSGSVEPTWPEADGATIVENTDGFTATDSNDVTPPTPPGNTTPQGSTTERYE